MSSMVNDRRNMLQAKNGVYKPFQAHNSLSSKGVRGVKEDHIFTGKNPICQRAKPSGVIHSS